MCAGIRICVYKNIICTYISLQFQTMSRFMYQPAQKRTSCVSASTASDGQISQMRVECTNRGTEDAKSMRSRGWDICHAINYGMMGYN